MIRFNKASSWSRKTHKRLKLKFQYWKLKPLEWYQLKIQYTSLGDTVFHQKIIVSTYYQLLSSRSLRSLQSQLNRQPITFTKWVAKSWNSWLKKSKMSGHNESRIRDFYRRRTINRSVSQDMGSLTYRSGSSWRQTSHSTRPIGL